MGKRRKGKIYSPASLRDKPRSRGFTGCGTCRSRHLKCDEAKPTCSTCRRLDLPCQGYAPRLLWIASQQCGGDLEGPKGEASSFRYPLFTEAHRSSMSFDMVQSLGDQSAGEILLDLDTESVSDDELHAVGPFGVFRACDGPSSLRHSTSSPSDDNEEDVEDVSLGLLQAKDLSPFPADFFAHLAQDQPSPSFGADLGGPEKWLNIGMAMNMPWDSSAQGIVPDGFSMQLLSPCLDSPDNNVMEAVPTSESSQVPTTQPDTRLSDVDSILPSADLNSSNHASSALSTFSPPINCVPRSGTSLPQHAASLLRYLKTKVFEDRKSMSTRSMSPWKLLLLPCALETFAEVSLWDSTTHARRSILSTLLAKSAFHLSKSTAHDESTASFWLKVGVDHHHDAQKHLKSALKGELGMNANYAEMLMAILGVGIVSVYYHGARVVKQLLLDAEYLIRSQGLPATKTFAHRVLHHLYTHLRVIMESTSIMSKSVASKDGEQWRLASQLVQTPMPSQFRVNAQNLGKLDSTHPKPEDVGYNDIHLDVSGIWQATLYPEIFGVPETLMTLLSQTISLVNERPRLQAASLNNPMVSAALSQHIKTLEQQIWSWSLQRSNAPFGPRPPQFLLDEAEAPVNRQQAESMILSMHQALIIFFYRRVYNISAMVIQDQVKKTLEFVQPCLEMERFDADFSVSISWSTFIAAAEAATPDLQELGLRCLEAVDDRGMFIERGKPSAMAKAVWEHRRRTNDFSYGWPDMMAVWNPQLRCSA